MLKLKGQLSISRPHGRGPAVVHITLGDADASATAVEIEMDLADFAECLFARGDCPCTFEFNDSGTVGTIHEHKTEIVPVPPYDSRDKAGKWKRDSLAPFEVDGWHARGGDINNHHCAVKGRAAQSVVFFRNVPRPAPAPEPIA